MEQFSSHWEKVFPPHSHSVGSPLTPLSVEHTHLSSPALCEKNNWAAHKHHYPLPPAHTHTHDVWQHGDHHVFAAFTAPQGWQLFSR